MSHICEDAAVQVILDLCERIGSVKALGAHICLSNGEFREYLNLEVRAQDYTDAKAFAEDYNVVCMLKKYVYDSGIDCRAVAIQSWRQAETSCLTTNDELDGRLGNPRVYELYARARAFIADCLGQIRIGECMRRCEWSGGASFDRRRGSSVTDKMTFPLTVTRGALPYIKAYLTVDTGWSSVKSPSYNLVRGNRMVTVPKSAKTDRCICIEPTANIFLQKGVGSYIRSRLQRFGVDLNDQTVNQGLARRAFAHGLSTIDLKSASDTISWRTVFLLLPIDWFSFLDDLRCDETLVDGSWILAEKFSSMGNGFTFELESLIFWGLCKAVVSMQPEGCDRTVGVYGDDLVVPRGTYDDVVGLLTEFGFTVNSSKSFKDGDFFESCGKHFFKGVDVTPFYQKAFVNKDGLLKRDEHVRLFNRVMRWTWRVWCSCGDEQTGRWLRTLRTQQWDFWGARRPQIPLGCPDDRGYLTDWSTLTYDKNHGFYCRAIVMNVSRSELENDLGYALYLRRSFTFGSTKGVTVVTTATEHFRLRNIYICYADAAEGLDRVTSRKRR